MKNTEFDRARTIRYLLLTFAVAWIMQAITALLYRNGNVLIGQLLMAVMMFVPALSVLLSGGKLRDLGWKPRIRKNIKPILAAWFGPALLTAAGALIYFMIFPTHLDLSGESLTVSAGAGALDQLKAQGLSFGGYILLKIGRAHV